MASSGSAKDRGKISGPLDRLNPREREILPLVASGMNNRSIGQKLFISDKTVKNYVTSIRKKLGLENRIQIALFAIEMGLIDPEKPEQ